MRRWEVDEAGSVLCPLAGFGASCDEPGPRKLATSFVSSFFHLGVLLEFNRWLVKLSSRVGFDSLWVISVIPIATTYRTTGDPLFNYVGGGVHFPRLNLIPS